jgi:gamma-aminobutyric acid type B receptor
MTSAKQWKRLKVSERDVLYPFAILFTVNVVLLVVWTVLDPLKWNRKETSETSSYGHCSTDLDNSGVTWKVAAALLAATNGAALILANVEAYKARAVSTEYGESKYIAMAMGSMLQIMLVGVPLLFLVDDNPSAKYFIRSSIVFIICMSILLFIFVPKVKVWYGLVFNKDHAKRNLSKRTSDLGLKFKVNVS